MRKLNLKLVLIQWLGIFFLIHGIIKIYTSFNVELIANMSKEKSYNTKYLLSFNEFLQHKVYYLLGAYLLGIIIITSINWKNKNHFFNTIIVCLLMFPIFPTGIFFRGLINNYFNYFGELFITDYAYSFIINGITYSLIASLFFWKSNRVKQSTAHNSHYNGFGHLA